MSFKSFWKRHICDEFPHPPECFDCNETKCPPDVDKILEDFDNAVDELIRTMRSAFRIPPKGG